MLRAAARRGISLAPARSAQAPQVGGPERRAMEASWVPLYTRLATLPPGRPPGSVAAELDAWLRERRPLSEEQIVAYVRKLRKFSQKACALEVRPGLPNSSAKCWPYLDRDVLAPLFCC